MTDLSKLQYFSGVNSFKNDGFLYTGNVTFPTSIPAGSNANTSQSFTLPSAPVFSMLYAYYQEVLDAIQQRSVGSGYNGAEWYQSSIDNKIGVTVTAPAAQAGVIDAIIFPVINGNTVTVKGLVNNPYSVAVTLAPLTVPWAFIEYTMTS